MYRSLLPFSGGHAFHFSRMLPGRAFFSARFAIFLVPAISSCQFRLPPPVKSYREV
jgi:hypothetical protein